MRAFALAALAGLLTLPARAEEPPRNVTLLVGFTAGQGTDLASGVEPGGAVGQRLSVEPTYDQAAKFYAAHLGRFLPGNPQVTVKLAPGAASLVAARQLSRGPSDGSLIAMIGPAAVFDPVVTGNKPEAIAWIGARQRDDDVCFVRSDVPIVDFAGLRQRETFIAALTPTSRSFLYPRALDDLAGARLRIVPGYSSDFEVSRALDTGEAEGWCGWSVNTLRARHPDLLREGKIRLLVQFSRAEAGQGMSLPRASDLVEGSARQAMRALETQTRFGAFALAVAGATPLERLAELRAAYAAMLRDPEVLDDAARQGLDIDPVTGEELDAAMREVVDLPVPAREKLKAVLKPP